MLYLKTESMFFSVNIIFCFLFVAPEGPPRDLMIRQLNSSSCLVKWNEPLAEQRNGVITGYQVEYTQAK